MNTERLQRHTENITHCLQLPKCFVAKSFNNSYLVIIIIIIKEGVSRYSDSLRAGRSGDRIPVEARFSSSAQTGLGAHPASCKMGTGSFPGIKRPGRCVDHPPSSNAEVKERVDPYFHSPSGPSWSVLG